MNQSHEIIILLHGNHHGHEMKDKRELMRKAKVFNADINVVINGKRQNVGT